MYTFCRNILERARLMDVLQEEPASVERDASEAVQRLGSEQKAATAMA